MTSALLRNRRLVAASSAAAAAAASAFASSCDAKKKPRVLVTGFHDWRELEGNIWRCRDNPSCRLLLGAASEKPPVKRDGPLARALRESNTADFSFQTLPTTWGTSSGIDLTSYDIVIHLGLGVYDNHTTILLENSAYNMRNATADALRVAGSGGPIEEGERRIMKLESGQLTRYADLRREPSKLGNATDGGKAFTVMEAPARKENSYICNETHWRSLRAVSTATDAKPVAAYFIHVPYADPNREKGYEELAAAVATLVQRIVELER